MMKKLLALLCLPFLAGCSSFDWSCVEDARQQVITGRAECVLIYNNDAALHLERGKGVSPLLNVYDKHKEKMKHSIVVDKVVGRAAAAIAICGKVRHVHGEVMSEDAAAFLKEHNITSTHTLLVPRILNQKRDGICPMEKSVEGIADPEKALAALRAKIASFRKGK